MLPAPLPELAEVKMDDRLELASRRRRAASVASHSSWGRARLAVAMTRFAARLDNEASRSVLATGATSRLHGPAGAGR
jgi:hypothetical protein